MVWNVFYVVFVLIAIAAVAMFVRFMIKKKIVLIIIPLLMIACSIAFIVTYYTAASRYDSPETVTPSFFPSTISTDFVSDNFEEDADGAYTKTSEYDAGTVSYTVKFNESLGSTSDYLFAEPTIDTDEFTRSDMQGIFAIKYTDVIAERTDNFLALRTGKYQQEFIVKTIGCTCRIIITSDNKDTSDLISSMRDEVLTFTSNSTEQ